jgi:Zn-dependent peptidase ImmA (M78 family)
MDLDKKNKALVVAFVKHCKQELGIESKFSVILSKKGQKDPTAGTFNPSNKEIIVCCKNRAIADCLRTIAHELTHLKQLEQMDEGEGFPDSDEELQKFEDAANVSSGRIVRFWGREHREIYEDLK